MKIHNLMTLLSASLALVGMAACSNDFDAPDYMAGTMKVVSAETEIAAAGESKTIETTVPVAKATAAYQHAENGGESTLAEEEPWLDIQVSGTTVTITAGPNPTSQSRDVLLTLTSAEGESTSLNIQQQGQVFTTNAPKSLVLADKAGEYSYAMKSTMPVTFTVDQPWLSVESDGAGSFTIHTEENTTGSLRAATITYDVNGVKNTITVTQGSPSDLMGDYHFCYYDDEDEEWYYANATITSDGKTWSLEMPDYDWVLPVSVDEQQLSLDLPMGSYIGDYSAYKVHLVAGDSEQGYITWDESVSMSAQFFAGDYGQEADFEDNGSWAGYNVDAVYFYACSATPMTADNRVGYLIKMMYPYLLKADASGAKQAMPLRAPGRARAGVGKRQGDLKLKTATFRVAY